MKQVCIQWLRRAANRHAERQAQLWHVRIQAPDCAADDQQRFEAWLKRDPRNQRAYLQTEALWRDSDAIARQWHVQAPQPKQRPSLAPWLTAASTAASVLLLAWMLWPAPAPLAQSWAAAKRMEVNLADGSTMVLQQGALVSAIITSGSRALTLTRGNVFFDVAKDPNRPFIIDIPQGQVRVLGTRFGVSVTPADAEVTVLSGKVSVSPDDVTRPLTPLTANQQLRFSDTSDGAVAHSVNARQALTWRRASLRFNGQPLSAVALALGEHFGRELNVPDPQLRQQQVIAVIQLDSLDNALDNLAAALNLTIDVPTSGAINLRRRN